MSSMNVKLVLVGVVLITASYVIAQGGGVQVGDVIDIETFSNVDFNTFTIPCRELEWTTTPDLNDTHFVKGVVCLNASLIDNDQNVLISERQRGYIVPAFHRIYEDEPTISECYLDNNITGCWQQRWKPRILGQHERDLEDLRQELMSIQTQIWENELDLSNANLFN